MVVVYHGTQINVMRVLRIGSRRLLLLIWVKDRMLDSVFQIHLIYPILNPYKPIRPPLRGFRPMSLHTKSPPGLSSKSEKSQEPSGGF